MCVENLPKIFDPYFSTKERGSQRGMGLGLTIAYSIVKRHDGNISMRSNPGMGTAVDVYLPASENEPDEVSKGSFKNEEPSFTTKNTKDTK